LGRQHHARGSGAREDARDRTFTVVHRRDGWYVVGRGMLIPVADREEGDRTVAQMTNEGGSDDALRT
jgi:hypothetical protein